MILSHKKKFIYIHVYKVAGTSIRAVLKEYDDLSFSDFPLQENLKFFIGRYVKSFSKWSSDHINARQIKRHLPENIFSKYFKFAFVRNPWDWQVSLFHFMLQFEDHPQHNLIKKMKSFDEYIEWRIANDLSLQKEFLYDENDKMLVDFVGHLENLQNDFNTICDRIEIPRAQLPVINTSVHKPYKEYYNNHTRDLVYNAFKKDIDLFKYDF